VFSSKNNVLSKKTAFFKEDKNAVFFDKEEKRSFSKKEQVVGRNAGYRVNKIENK